MAYLIGTDEAGYGPNLGPLVITGTLWESLGERAEPDLYPLLDAAIVPCGSTRERRLVIADSKQVYKPRGTLAGLERGIHPLLRLCDCGSTGWRELLGRVAPEWVEDLECMPWHAGQDLRLPTALPPEEASRLAETVGGELQRVGVRLLAVRSAVVFPGRFNQLVARYGNKGQTLSRLTVALMADLVERAGEGEILICGDKHGGRNKYADLLQQAFPESLIEIHGESARQSLYRWGPATRRITARFMVQGEQFLPAALASMVSKYLRELSMQAFNDYWRNQVPGLRPTAGYPVDALRFRSDIEAACERLEIPWELVWRNC